MSTNDPENKPDSVEEFEVYGADSPTSNGVSDAINKLDRNNPSKYLVDFSGQNNLTFDKVYEVEEIGFGRGGAPNIKLQSNRGEGYTIRSNPNGRPKVVRRSDGFEERLSSLKIYSLEFEWEHWIKQKLNIE